MADIDIQHAGAGAGARAETDFDVVVVGAGFAGLYALHRLRGLGHSVRVYEAGSGVGGVWYWNRYPGARVDVDVREYSYGFSDELEDEWRWSEQYAPQPELEAYANHVAERFDLKRDIQLETRVTTMAFDEGRARWMIETDRGERVTARYCVMATGCLSVPKDIDLPGIERFKGPVYRTSMWPKEGVDFAGKTVGEIGTGSSGIQSIPVIAEQAAHLTVFQRTASFSLPSNNGPTDPAAMRDWLDNRRDYRRKQRESAFGLVMTDPDPRASHEASQEERRAAFEQRWAEGGMRMVGAFNDLLLDKQANDNVAEFVRDKIRGIVSEPETQNKLLPTSHPIFTKRPCVDTGYYETFNRDNVTLIDLRQEPLETVTESGIRAGGKDHDFDILVLAIGFDAMTGAMTRIDIRGRGGRRLQDDWAHGDAATYLGIGAAGYPNMFIITGPGSPSVFGNTIAAIEHEVDWIGDCIAYLAARQLDTIEVTPEAQEAWMEHVRTTADGTLFPLADSWYMGANVPGKTRAFLIYIGGWKTYLDRCDEVAEKGYEGFATRRAAGAPA